MKYKPDNPDADGSRFVFVIEEVSKTLMLKSTLI